MADGKTYRVMATDSAGTEFQIGAVDEALEALVMLKATPARLHASAMRVLTADGEPVEQSELRRLAGIESVKIAQEVAWAARRRAQGEAEPEKD